MIESIIQLIEAGKNIGSLSAAAVLALISIAEGVYIYKKMRSDAESSEKWRETRELSIRAEEHQTMAVASMATRIDMMAQVLNTAVSDLGKILTILDERGKLR